MLELNQTYHQLRQSLDLGERLPSISSNPAIVAQFERCRKLLDLLLEKLLLFRDRVAEPLQSATLDIALRNYRRAMELLAELFQSHLLTQTPASGRARTVQEKEEKLAQELRLAQITAAASALTYQCLTFVSMVKLEKLNIKKRHHLS